MRSPNETRALRGHPRGRGAARSLLYFRWLWQAPGCRAGQWRLASRLGHPRRIRNERATSGCSSACTGRAPTLGITQRPCRPCVGPRRSRLADAAAPRVGTEYVLAAAGGRCGARRRAMCVRAGHIVSPCFIACWYRNRIRIAPHSRNAAVSLPGVPLPPPPCAAAGSDRGRRCAEP